MNKDSESFVLLNLPLTDKQISNYERLVGKVVPVVEGLKKINEIAKDLQEKYGVDVSVKIESVNDFFGIMSEEVSNIYLQGKLDCREQQTNKFLELYVNDKEMKGDKIRCYVTAFGVDLSRPGMRNVVEFEASQLLSKKYILDKIKSWK